MLKFEELPALPEADRIMVMPDPPEKKTEGGIEIPDIAMVHANYGQIVAAGLKATDILYDNGDQIGDRIWFGKYAGVIEQWDHITEAGDISCSHDWERAPELSGPRMSAYRCACGAQRRQDPLLVMNVGDILANIDKAARFRRGEMTLIRGVTPDGKTCHVVERQYADTITSTLSNRIERTTNGAS